MAAFFSVLIATLFEELATAKRRVIVEGALTALLACLLLCAAGFGVALLLVVAIQDFGVPIALGLFCAGFLGLALLALGGLWLARRRARRRAFALRLQRQKMLRYAEFEVIGFAAESAGFLKGFLGTLVRGGHRP